LLYLTTMRLSCNFNSLHFSFFFLSTIVIFCSCRVNEGLPPGDADNGGLVLPGNFEAVVVADSIGRPRHLAVNTNGDVYVKLRSPNPKGIVGLRDTDNDGRADIKEVFGDYEDTGEYGTGMRIYNGYIYFSTAGEVYRQKLSDGELVPDSKVELILKDDFRNDVHGAEHIAKPITFDNNGHMYVQFGAPGDVCQELDRIPGAPGMNPCPELEEHGGIWQFDANKLNQTIKDGKRYATGIRSVVGMSWNNADNTLYALQHGRDDMHRTWPERFTKWQSAVLPSEEFLMLKEGADAGWPYYYYDHMQKKKLLNPEYGGDGKKEGKGSDYTQPIMGFPGHWAPNDVLFYTGDQFPDRYKNGAFIAFHGSTIRNPYPQAGYFIGFIPFENGKPTGEWEVFADGFAQVDTIVNTSDARYRPMGLAQGPDGSLYISESERGRIWRVMYKGNKNQFGKSELANMEKRKLLPHIKTPDEKTDAITGRTLSKSAIYDTYCVSCHQADGNGDGNRFPPIAESEWVTGDSERLIKVLLQGLEGPITVKGKKYNNVMPSHKFLDDEQIAEVLTYIRQNFGNKAEEIKPIDVYAIRKSLSK
jgi:glucose/arabinose dehydrogenase/mono/diheme cytochrome c family protein